MEIASIFTDIVYGDEHPAIKVMFQTPAIKEIRIVFKAGQTMKAHKAGFPIVVAVMAGSIDFGVDGQVHMLEPGMMIALDANVVHELHATADSIVRLSLNKADNTERVQQAVAGN